MSVSSLPRATPPARSFAEVSGCPQSASPGSPKHAALSVLLIEDDWKMAAYLAQELTILGHSVQTAGDGETGLKLTAEGNFDAIIVDRMLPGVDGLSMVKQLRGRGSELPVIFLTTMTGIGDRVDGLEAGADDYLVKPFAFEELMARLAAITRRHSSDQSRTKIRIGDLEIDLLTHEAARAGAMIDLMPQEFRILAFLAQNDGRIVTRAMLLKHVWGFHFDPKTSVVETHISRLRAKIDRGGAASLLRTVRGAGYSLRAD